MESQAAQSLNTRTYTYMDMGTKTLTITNEAYERLAALKEHKESFSEVITKITQRHSLRDLVGILTPAEAKELKVTVEETRKRFRKDVDERARRLR